MSSAACALPLEPLLDHRHRPPTLRRAVAGVRRAGTPPQTRGLGRLFDRLRVLREQRDGLVQLVALARTFTPEVAVQVEALTTTAPDEALIVFATAFQRTHFELDETVYWDGFETWVDSGGTRFIPLLMRGHDRCNGLEAEDGPPGLMLLWALLEDVWWDDERARIIAETVDTFGEHLADRLAAATPPEHRVLCQRLGNSPYAGMVAFSCWVLGDVDNDLI